MASLAITKNQLKRGCRQQFADYLSGQGSYHELVESTFRRPLPYYATVPGIQLLINASLDTLSLPKVAARLPVEVNERKDRADACVNRVVKLMLNPEYRPRFEEAQKTFFKGRAGEDNFAHFTKYLLKGPVQAGLHDASRIGGGAVRALQEAGIREEDEPYAAILTRSPGLLAVAKIHQPNYKELNQLLGSPYAKPEHYTIMSAEEGRYVDFTQMTQKAIRALGDPGSGCPVRRFPSPFTEGVNLLQDTWNQLMTYLIPPGATVLNDS